MEYRPICILYEDAERTEKLIEAIVEVGFPEHLIKKWVIVGGFLDIDFDTPPQRKWLYFSRLSASASMRKHEHSIAYGTHILDWLNFHGCDVINGNRAFQLETSKVQQCMALQRVGLLYPSTRLISSESAIPSAVATWFEKKGTKECIVYLKPVTGGSGLAVKRYASLNEFKNEKKDKTKKPVKAPNSLYIFQEGKEQHITWYHRTKKKIMGEKKVFYRAEFVNQRFLYLLRVATPVSNVSSCPCDAATSMDNEFDIVPDPVSHFGEKIWKIFIEKCIQFMKMNAMFVGAFEFSQPTKENFYVFDINTNTNYSEKAEKKIEKRNRGFIQTAIMLAQYATSK